jgi:choline dehydrogenase-like flavoprotein
VPENRRIIVIGTGPAGAAAALFASKRSAEVLLLEAGSRRAASGLTVRIGGFTVFKRKRPLRQRAAFVATGDPKTELFEELAPGGLTNHWSCAVPRFAPEDFADARRAGEEFAWPIGYEDLEPWYDRVEPLLRIAGAASGSPRLPAGRVRQARELASAWADVRDAAENAGRTVTPMPYAFGAETTVTFSGTVFNSFVRLLAPEIRGGRLETRFDARVARLEWSRDGQRVRAVILRDPRTGAEEALSCRAVIVAAGAISTAEILLGSGSAEFPEGLGNTHGVLGRYLHDHPLGKLILDLDRPVSFHPASYLTRAALDRSAPLFAAACMQWSGVEMIARSLLNRTPGALPWVGFSVFGTMPPSRENGIAVDDPPSGAASRRGGMRLHITIPPKAVQTLEEARDAVTSVLTRAGHHPTVRVWHVEPPGESKHYGGTCRMHADPRFGMLDGWNRLHVVRNVAVVDSSAFTTGPEKNPVLTAMAISARAADRLADEVSRGDL